MSKKNIGGDAVTRTRKSFLHSLYVWLIILVSYILIADLFFQKPLSLDLWREYTVLTALGVLAELFVVSVPQGSFSLGFAIVCVSYLCFDLSATVLISVVSALIGNSLFSRGFRFKTVLFNGAQYALSALGASAVYDYLGGQAADKISITNFVPLIAFLLTYFIINHLVVTLYIWPSIRSQFWNNWSTSLRWDIFTYIIASPIGILMTLIYDKTGLLGAVLLFIPMLTLKYFLKLYINLETANKELSALYEVARNLGTSLDMTKTLGLILSETKKVVNYDTGIIYLWEEEEAILIPTAIRSKQAEQLKNITYHLGDGIVGRVAETKEAKIVYDSKADKSLRNVQGINQVLRSLLVIPLIMDNKLIGVVAVGKKNPYAFDHKHLQILSSLGGQAAVVMANSMLYKKIEKLAITDGLTKVYNHRHFYKRIEEEAERAKRYGTKFSLIMLDIDYFKKFNDKYGHRAGDGALQFVSRGIIANTRALDVVCRYGGEEFAIILPETESDSSVYVAERIRKTIQDTFFPVSEGLEPVSVTVSIGTATFPSDSDDTNELIEMADKALYYSKKSGRNRVSSWHELPVTQLN